MGNSHPNVKYYDGTTMAYSQNSIDSRHFNGNRLNHHQITDRPQKFRNDSKFLKRHSQQISKAQSNTDIYKVGSSSNFNGFGPSLHNNHLKTQGLPKNYRNADSRQKSSKETLLQQHPFQGNCSQQTYKNPKYFSLNLDATLPNVDSLSFDPPSITTNSLWQLSSDSHINETDMNKLGRHISSRNAHDNSDTDQVSSYDKKSHGRSLFFNKRRKNKGEQDNGHLERPNNGDNIGRRTSCSSTIKPTPLTSLHNNGGKTQYDKENVPSKKVLSRLSSDHGTHVATVTNYYSSKNSDTDYRGAYNVNGHYYTSYGSSPFCTSDSNYASEDASSGAKISISKSFVFSRDPYGNRHDPEPPESPSLLESQLSSYRKLTSPTYVNPILSQNDTHERDLKSTLKKATKLGTDKAPKETQWKMFAKFVEPTVSKQPKPVNGEHPQPKAKPIVWVEENKRGKRRPINSKCKRSQSAFSLYKMLLHSNFKDELDDTHDGQIDNKPGMNSDDVAKINIPKSLSSQNLSSNHNDGICNVGEIISPAPSEDSGRSSNSTMEETGSSKQSRNGSSSLSDIMEFNKEKINPQPKSYTNYPLGKDIVIEAYPAVVTHNIVSKMTLDSFGQQKKCSYDSGKANSVLLNEWTADERKQPNEDTGYSSHSEENNEAKRTKAQNIFFHSPKQTDKPLRYGSPFRNQEVSYGKYPMNYYQCKNSNPDLSKLKAMRLREGSLCSKSYDNIYFVRNGNWILKKEKALRRPVEKPASTLKKNPNESTNCRSNLPRPRSNRAFKDDSDIGSDGVSDESDSNTSVTSKFINNQFSYLYNSDIYEDIEDIRAKAWKLPAYQSKLNNKLSSAVSYEPLPRPGAGRYDRNKGTKMETSRMPSNQAVFYDQIKSHDINRLGRPMLSSGFPYRSEPTDAQETPNYVFNDMEAYIQNQRQLDKVLIQENWRNRSQPCLTNPHMRLIEDPRISKNQESRESYQTAIQTLNREVTPCYFPKFCPRVEEQSRIRREWFTNQNEHEVINSRQYPQECESGPHFDQRYIMVPNANYVYYDNSNSELNMGRRGDNSNCTSYSVVDKHFPHPAYKVGGGGHYGREEIPLMLRPSPKPGWNLNRKQRPHPNNPVYRFKEMEGVHNVFFKKNLPTHSANNNSAHFMKRSQQNLHQNAHNQGAFVNHQDWLNPNFKQGNHIENYYSTDQSEVGHDVQKPPVEFIPRIQMPRVKMLEKPLYYKKNQQNSHPHQQILYHDNESSDVSVDRSFNQIPRPKSMHSDFDNHTNLDARNGASRLASNGTRHIDSWSSEAFLNGIPMIPKEIRNCHKKSADQPRIQLLKRDLETRIKQNGCAEPPQSLYSMENIDYTTDASTKLSNNPTLIKSDVSSRANKIKKFQSDENLKLINKCPNINEELPQGGNFWKRMSWLEKSTAQKQVNMKTRPLPTEPKTKKDKDNIRNKK